MASLEAPPREPDGFSEAMAGLDHAIGGLRDSAHLARLTDDPAAPSLEALVRVFGAATRQFQVRDRERKEIAMAMDMRARRIAALATTQIQASGTAIIEKLAPDLGRLVERTIRQRMWTIRTKTLLAAGGAATVLTIASFAVGYGTAYKAGRNEGLLDGKTISAALTSGPDAAHAWARLMADNDPVRALQTCRAASAKDVTGRRYCLMPFWLDPPSPPDSSTR